MTAACVAQSVRRLRCANSALFQVISGEAVAAYGQMGFCIVDARWLLFSRWIIYTALILLTVTSLVFRNKSS